MPGQQLHMPVQDADSRRFVGQVSTVVKDHPRRSSQLDAGPAPLGFFFERAPDRAAERLPPAFIDIYADWVVDPR